MQHLKILKVEHVVEDRVIRTEWVNEQLIGYLADYSTTVLIDNTLQYKGLRLVK